MCLLLIDHLWCLEFLVLFILDIAEQEDEVLAFTRLQGYLDIMRSDRTPTMSMTVAGLTLHHSLRISKLIVQAYEGLTVGIKALDRGVHMIECIVVTTLTILGLVVDRRAFDLYLTRREITLEIFHVGSSIPQAPLLEGEELQRLRLAGLVLQGEFLHLAPFLQGYEEEHRSLHTVLLTCDTGVTHTMTALVEVERRLTGLPTRIPHGIAILDVEVAATVVHRYVVVTIAGDTTELRILVEAVTAGGVRDQ